MQNFVKAKDNSEHLSVMVSSLHMQLDESNAEKTQLLYENKSLRARLAEMERSEKAKTSHKSSVQEKDTAAARESANIRHGVDGKENYSHPHSTGSLVMSESAQQRDHIIVFAGSDHSGGDRKLAAPVVCPLCQTPLLFQCCY